MGYYSEYDIDCQARGYKDTSAGLELLELQLSDLRDRLLSFDEHILSDPLHPLHDRYFYTDHIVEQYEIPDTVLGLIDAIQLVERQIEERKLADQRRTLFVASIFETGATPDGQVALPIHLFSPYDIFEAAA